MDVSQLPVSTPYLCKGCRSEVLREKGIVTTYDQDGEPTERQTTIHFCSNPICIGNRGMDFDDMDCGEDDLTPDSL